MKELKLGKPVYLAEGEHPIIGISYDFKIPLLADEKLEGEVYITDYRDSILGSMSDGTIYIEWIIFTTAYRGKGMLRSVLDQLVSEYGILTFAGTDETTPKYLHLGAEVIGIADNGEDPLFRYGK